MWQRHWGLLRDPFTGVDSPYVPLPSHDEAVSRLVYSIERAERRVAFWAEGGLGKTTVLRRAIAEARSPRRRFALIPATADRMQFVNRIAARLGQPLGREPSWQATRRVLARALRVAMLEGFQIILAIDGGDDRPAPGLLHDLDALTHLGGEAEAPLSIIRVGRTPRDPRCDPADPWALAIRLRRLTRSEVEVYLAAKLAAAGCAEQIFTPRALTRLHSLSGGVPRGIERLATLSLIAGAVRGLEVIAPDIIEGVSRECWGGMRELGPEDWPARRDIAG